MSTTTPEGDCSIIALDKFIQATRDSGYKGTANAVLELVDNSIQAEARPTPKDLGDLAVAVTKVLR